MMGRAPASRQRLSDIVFLGEIQWDPAAVDACLDELLPAAPVRRQPRSVERTTIENATGPTASPVAEEQQQEQLQQATADRNRSIRKQLPSARKKLVDASVQTATVLQVQPTEEYDGSICTIDCPLECREACRRIIETLIEEELHPSRAVPSHDAAVANDLDQRLEAIKSFRRALHTRILQSEPSASTQDHAKQAVQIEEDAERVG